MKRNLWHDYVKSASHHKNTCHLVAEYASQKLSRYVGEQCWWWPPAGWTGQDIQKRPGLSSVGLRCCSPGRIPLCLLSRPSLQLRTALAWTGHLQNMVVITASRGLLVCCHLSHSPIVRRKKNWGRFSRVFWCALWIQLKIALSLLYISGYSTPYFLRA